MAANPNQVTRKAGGANAKVARLVDAHTREDHAETIRLGETLARRFPGMAGVQTLLGNARLCRGELPQAERAFRLAVRADPRSAGNHTDLAVALIGRQKFDEAEQALADALSLDPAHTDAHMNLCILHERQGRLDAAIDSCRTVLDLAPDHLDARFRLGTLYRRTRRFQEATNSHLQLLRSAPEHALALLDLGCTLLEADLPEQAAHTLRLAIKADPANADAHLKLGLALMAAGKTEEAIVALARTTETLPDNCAIWARLLSLQAYICDWSARHVLSLLPIKVDGAVVPFDALPFEDDPQRQLQRSQAYAANQRLSRPAAPFVPRPSGAGDRIRIGYFSADLYAHATMHLMSGLLREHDRARFDIRAYDFSPGDGREGQRRVGDHVDALIDLRRMADHDAIALVRSHDLDIAVDLKGYTKDNRAGIFAGRVAPVQINYLGYPGSIGVDFMDYLIADPIVVPPGDEGYYSERIIRLPGSYQPNDNQREIATIADDRRSLGLPDDGFVFCCFNQGYKIGPAEFDIWMALLREVEGSVLWLLGCSDLAEANLRKEAGARGVDPARLVFAPKRKHAEHLARQRHADLFLDTFAVNAHTTASDALWGGLPVLTLAGRQFAARVAASVVHAVGLPELIAVSASDYAQKALDLATTPPKLAAIRARLAANRLTHPLFDTVSYARRIEAAYEAAHQRRLQDLPPDHIWIR